MERLDRILYEVHGPHFAPLQPHGSALQLVEGEDLVQSADGDVARVLDIPHCLQALRGAVRQRQVVLK